MSAVTSSFQRIYAQNLWGFGSGHGSLPRATKTYRTFVETFIRENGVKSVIDFGCGDWQFSRFIDWSGSGYLGLDVNAGLIQRNRSKYASDAIRFEVAPERFSDVPGGELLLVKDVLQHLPTAVVHQFMAEVVTRFRFALITNCVRPAAALNREIEIGDWRPLDLRARPYSFDVPAVFAFSGSPVFSISKLRAYPRWHKVVLLFSNTSDGHSSSDRRQPIKLS
jgi:hypothetical protein